MKKQYDEPKTMLLILPDTDIVRTSEVDPENPVLKIHDLGGRDIL